jgi:hypothetical protein
MAGDRRRPLDLAIMLASRGLLVVARQREVELASFPREQIVVERLTKQRVAEVEATILATHEHLFGDRLTQRRLEGIMCCPGELGQRSFIEPSADGDRPRSPLRVGRQPLDPEDERVAQALGGGAAAVQPGGQQLFAVERVTLAANEQSLHEAGLGGGAENVRQRLG